MNKKKTIANEYSARHSLSMQQSLGRHELGNFSWLPGADNPADGPAAVRRDTVPLLRLGVSGALSSGAPQPLHSVTIQAREKTLIYSSRVSLILYDTARILYSTFRAIEFI